MYKKKIFSVGNLAARALGFTYIHIELIKKLCLGMLLGWVRNLIRRINIVAGGAINHYIMLNLFICFNIGYKFK